MINSKGVKDNKCLENIDLSSIEKEISNLKTAVTDLPSKVTAYGDFVVTQAHFEAKVHGGNVGYGDNEVTKSGYFPLGVVGYNTTNDIVSGTNYVGVFRGQYLTNRQNGRATLRTYVSGASKEAAMNGIQGTAQILWIKIK